MEEPQNPSEPVQCSGCFLFCHSSFLHLRPCERETKLLKSLVSRKWTLDKFFPKGILSKSFCRPNRCMPMTFSNYRHSLQNQDIHFFSSPDFGGFAGISLLTCLVAAWTRCFHPMSKPLLTACVVFPTQQNPPRPKAMTGFAMPCSSPDAPVRRTRRGQWSGVRVK